MPYINIQLFQVIGSSSKTEKEKRKSVEEISRSFNAIRNALLDRSDTQTVGKEKDTEFANAERARINEIISDITQEITNRDMLPLILEHLDALEFEVPFLL